MKTKYVTTLSMVYKGLGIETKDGRDGFKISENKIFVTVKG